MSKTITFTFGNLPFAVICRNNDASSELLRKHFADYSTNIPPEITLHINAMPSIKANVMPRPGTRYLYKVAGEEFDFGPGLIRGRWDAQERTCHVDICDFLFSPDEIWLFDRILCRLYYTLALRNCGAEIKTLILHSCGVVKNGLGYLFFGPPEAGKSTCAALSRQYTLLHDDMNLVSFENGKAQVEGVPFNPKNILRKKSIAPLGMICSLHKSPAVRLEQCSPAAFVKDIFPEVFLPLGVLDEDRNRAFLRMMDFLKRLSEQIPYYKLYFRKDPTFWEAIKTQEEEENGSNRKNIGDKG